jgi:nucleotide-binding universal stress UspA family protein
MKTKSADKPEATPVAAQSVGDKAMERPAAPQGPSLLITFKRILVPIDFSGCSLGALHYALALAEKFAAKLIFLHVVEPAVYPQNYLITPATLDETNQNLLAVARERLAEVKQKATARGLPSETLVRMGRAQSEISDTAKATGTDLIVMGTHGYSGLKQVLLGGTAERVVRHSPCPVLTVRHA